MNQTYATRSILAVPTPRTGLSLAGALTLCLLVSATQIAEASALTRSPTLFVPNLPPAVSVVPVQANQTDEIQELRDVVQQMREDMTAFRESIREMRDAAERAAEAAERAAAAAEASAEAARRARMGEQQ